MLFKDFKNIQIENMIGVSPIGKDTLMLAKNAIKLEFTNALDIGTGTGFVPIYLKICGRNCDAVDINLTAIKCAEKNALNNQIKINVKISNLFDNVEKKYDLIIFNPPFGNMGSIKSSRYLEIIKSLIPKNNLLVAKISYPFIKKNRIKLIKRFFKECKKVLESNGEILIFLHKNELEFLKNTSFEIIDKYDDMNLILIQHKK